jgi:hypothetical protein
MLTRSVRRWIVLLLAVLLLLTLLQQSLLIRRIWFDGENSVDESESLFALTRLHTGAALYLDYSQSPHVITCYMPLFYWTTAWITKAARSWWQMVVLARWSVYACWVGIGVAIFALARQARCGWPAALLAALLWGGSKLGQEWANSLRPDAAALFFSLMALWVYERRRTGAHLVLGVMLLAAAALYKHTVVAPLVVILWEEVADHHSLRAVAVLAAWGGTMAIVAISAQSVTGGLFSLNVFTSLAVAQSGSWPWVLLVMSLALGAAAFWGAALACVSIPQRHGVTLWKRYFIISLLLALARSRIFGAWTNHYLEPFAAGCVLTGVLVQDLSARGPKEAVHWASLCWLMAAMGITSTLLIDQARQVIRSGVDHEDMQWKWFVSQIGRFDGPVLSEDGYVTVRSGRIPYMVDANKFAHLQRDKKFDDSTLLHMIETGGFAAIVTRVAIDANPRPTWAFPSRWLAPMRRRYRLAATCPVAERDATFYVYVPVGGR